MPVAACHAYGCVCLCRFGYRGWGHGWDWCRFRGVAVFVFPFDGDGVAAPVAGSLTAAFAVFADCPACPYLSHLSFPSSATHRIMHDDGHSLGNSVGSSHSQIIWIPPRPLYGAVPPGNRWETRRDRTVLTADGGKRRQELFYFILRTSSLEDAARSYPSMKEAFTCTQRT